MPKVKLKRRSSTTTRKALKKRSKAKLSALKRKLWQRFSTFIKERDNYTCFTCNRKGEGAGMHAGHYIPDAVGGLALRYHEQNVHAQCFHCNINLGGYGAMYHKKMVEKYGNLVVEKLWKLKNKVTKDFDYQKKLDYYDQLRNRRG